nr:hypothetical protein [Candidatus Microthrix sp.]
MDLIVERDDGRIVAIETRLATTVSQTTPCTSAGFVHRLGDDLLDAVVVTSGRCSTAAPKTAWRWCLRAPLGP